MFFGVTQRFDEHPTVDKTSAELNYVVVNGVRSPGRATIQGADVPYSYDVKTGYGLEGATTIFKGRGIAKFTLTIEIWERGHFSEWGPFKKLLEPPTAAKPLAFDMQHPLLSDQDIKSVVVESFGQLERQSNGVWKSVIKLLEWRPQKDVGVVKPRGSIPGVGGNPWTAKTEADIALVEDKAKLEVAYTASERRR